MEEIFDSEHYNVRYDKDSNAAVLVWKEYSETDHFRTPLMKSADIIRRHRCSDLIIDRSKITKIGDKDIHWVSKILIPALKRSGCKRIIIISGDDKPISVKDYPYSSLSGQFSIRSEENVESAIASLVREQTGGVSDEIRKMTREDALKYMELPADTSWEEIDDKFWQMGKNIRKLPPEETEKKLDELSAVYDIATGKRDEREEAERIRAGKKKYFGKTAGEWGTYFSYTWYKYLLAIVAIVVSGNLLYTIFLKPANDVSIVGVGHFFFEGSYYEDITAELGYTNPYIISIDLAVPNDEDQAGETYSEQTSAAAMMSNPNIIISDERTVRYYFGTYADLTDYYEGLADVLPADVYEQLIPVYCSEQDFQDLAVNYEMEKDDGEVYDTTEIIIGIEVTDPEFISELGYTTLWPNDDPNLVFCVGGGVDDIEAAEAILTRILSDLS